VEKGKRAGGEWEKAGGLLHFSVLKVPIGLGGGKTGEKNRRLFQLRCRGVFGFLLFQNGRGRENRGELAFKMGDRLFGWLRERPGKPIVGKGGDFLCL